MRLKDPFNEPEFGDYYARHMLSYGMLIAASGLEKNGPQKMLGFNPPIQPETLHLYLPTGTAAQRAQASVTQSGKEIHSDTTPQGNRVELSLQPELTITAGQTLEVTLTKPTANR